MSIKDNGKKINVVKQPEEGDMIRPSTQKNSWDADITPVHLGPVKSSQNKAMWFFPDVFTKDASRYLWTQWTKPE